MRVPPPPGSGSPYSRAKASSWAATRPWMSRAARERVWVSARRSRRERMSDEVAGDGWYLLHAGEEGVSVYPQEGRIFEASSRWPSGRGCRRALISPTISPVPRMARMISLPWCG